MSGKRNCGECLMNDVEIVELDAKGVCPRCGTDYGPPPPDPKPKEKTTRHGYPVDPRYRR